MKVKSTFTWTVSRCLVDAHQRQWPKMTCMSSAEGKHTCSIRHLKVCTSSMVNRSSRTMGLFSWIKKAHRDSISHIWRSHCMCGEQCSHVNKSLNWIVPIKAIVSLQKMKPLHSYIITMSELYKTSKLLLHGLSMEEQIFFRFHWKYLDLCSSEESNTGLSQHEGE